MGVLHLQYTDLDSFIFNSDFSSKHEAVLVFLGGDF